MTVQTRPPVCHHGKCKISPPKNGQVNGIDLAPEGLLGVQHYAVYKRMAKLKTY